jgi:hypothetical protein
MNTIYFHLQEVVEIAKGSKRLFTILDLNLTDSIFLGETRNAGQIPVGRSKDETQDEIRLNFKPFCNRKERYNMKIKRVKLIKNKHRVPKKILAFKVLINTSELKS